MFAKRGLLLLYVPKSLLAWLMLLCAILPAVLSPKMLVLLFVSNPLLSHPLKPVLVDAESLVFLALCLFVLFFPSLSRFLFSPSLKPRPPKTLPLPKKKKQRGRDDRACWLTQPITIAG
ncbi:hypothetical protein C8J56DRAFT_924600 [Mycena floridula]|nr:hypothetical protein C8J56DRAFT_924600 [Mycena floridula]